MSNEAQNLKNHARFDPLYHFLIAITLIVNVVYAIVNAVKHPTAGPLWFVVLSIVAFIAVLRMRQYPLKVQDRVIRMEERLRLQALAPVAWHAQIYRLSEHQLIALRFASDDEVVELAKQALEHNLTRKQIKERIKNWRADDWRV
jgi:Family of unknown function (DUF6526)